MRAEGTVDALALSGELQVGFSHEAQEYSGSGTEGNDSVTILVHRSILAVEKFLLNLCS
jgi:hypothetical protein